MSARIAQALKRYDTLVISGASSKEVPREAAGGRVVAWAAGHSLAELGPLETFVQELADCIYEDESIHVIQKKALEALEQAKRQRDKGWINSEEENHG